MALLGPTKINGTLEVHNATTIHSRLYVVDGISGINDTGISVPYGLHVSEGINTDTLIATGSIDARGGIKVYNIAINGQIQRDTTDSLIINPAVDMKNGLTVSGGYINLNAVGSDLSLKADQISVIGSLAISGSGSQVELTNSASLTLSNTSNATFNNGLTISGSNLITNSGITMKGGAALTSGTLIINSGASLENNGTTTLNGTTNTIKNATLNNTTTFNSNMRFKDNTLFSTENNPTEELDDSVGVGDIAAGTSITVTCPGYTSFIDFSQTVNGNTGYITSNNFNVTKISDRQVTVKNISGNNYFKVTMGYKKKVVNSSNSINIGKNQVYGNGIAIGKDIYVTTGTHIGCGKQLDKPTYLCLGINGALTNYMTSSGTNWAGSSDRRDKTDFLNISKKDSLNFIKSLQGLTYVYNKRDWYKDENNDINYEAYNNGERKQTRRTAGFIAQDVYQTMIDIFGNDNYAAIVDYSGYNTKSEDGNYYMRTTELIPFLVEAIKAQQEQIDELKSKLKI